MNKQNILNEFWHEKLAQHSGRVIDADNQLDLSYIELDKKIEMFAKNILGTRQLVALIADNSLAFVIAYLALLRYQHVILILENDMKQDTQLDNSLDNSLDKLLDNKLFSLSSKNKKLIEQYPINYLVFGKSCHAVNTHPIALHPTLALLLSTSGSTGSAKLVKLSYKNLIANSQSICQYLPMTSNDTVVTTLPLHYSFGLSILHSHLALGATIVLTNSGPLEKSLWQIYKDHQPQSFYGVPFSFELINKLQLKRLPLNSVRYFAQAGGKISSDIAHIFSQWCHEHKQQLFLMYGQTEATARIAYLSPNKLPNKVHCIGQAIPNGQLRLIDNNGNDIIRTATSGELYYRGDNVFIGYATNIYDLSSAENIEWLATGDIARFDADGDFEITGRNKRIIKIVGKRISLDEIEQHLLQHYSVGIAVSGKDDRLVIHFDNPDVEKALLDLTLKFTQINTVYLKLNYCQNLPRLSNGKVAYGQLDD